METMRILRFVLGSAFIAVFAALASFGQATLGVIAGTVVVTVPTQPAIAGCNSGDVFC